MTDDAGWFEKLRAQGFVGYSLNTGELVKDVQPNDFLPLERWPDYRLHGFRAHSADKLLKHEDIEWVNVRDLTEHQRAELEKATGHWKRLRSRYQGAFREATLRDLARCATCGSDEDLEAAHALQSALDWTRDFDIEQAHNALLGVTLCNHCHRNFDRSKYDRDTELYAKTYAATEARVFERVLRIRNDSTNPRWDLEIILADALLKARNAWAFDFSVRGVPMAAGWQQSRFLQVWTAPEDDRDQAPPASFVEYGGVRVERLEKLSPKWVSSQWKKQDAFDLQMKRALREEARTRSRQRAKERTAANEPVREKIIEVLKSAQKPLSYKEIAERADIVESRVKTELTSSRAALVPRGLVRSAFEGNRRVFRVEVRADDQVPTTPMPPPPPAPPAPTRPAADPKPAKKKRRAKRASTERATHAPTAPSTHLDDERQAERDMDDFFRTCPDCGGHRRALTPEEVGRLDKRRAKAAAAIKSGGGDPLICESCFRVSEQVVFAAGDADYDDEDYDDDEDGDEGM